jgi:cytidine deaminase
VGAHLAEGIVSDAELYERARERLNRRKLSALADAGGVASALVTRLGNVHVGVCIVTSSSLGSCAEHTAIGSMITAGESAIHTIVAVKWDGRILSPCGRCREFIYQVDDANAVTRVLLPGGRVATIAELLPDHWAREPDAVVPS